MAVESNRVVTAKQLYDLTGAVKTYTDTTSATTADTKINALDANVSSSANNNVQVQVVETAGKITSISVIKDDTVTADDVSAAIATALANYGGFQVVSLNPSTGKPDVSEPSTKIIYLTKDASSQVTDPYTEWIWTDGNPGAWEVIGETTVDLSDYYTKTESDNRFMLVSKVGSHVYSWPSATPIYNYVVLANFIQGHSTGTITEGSWITDVMSDDAKSAAWIWGDYSGYLVDSTVGSPMVDPRSPIDFSAYGVSNGTPYGLITCNLDDTNCRLIYDTTGVSKTSMTAEMWVFGCSDYPEDGYNTNGPEPLMTIGAMDRHEGSQWEDLINLTMYLNTADGYEDVCGIHVVIAQGTTDYNGEGVLFYLSPETLSTLFGTTVVFDEWVKDWHHYAICIDTSNLYFFIDGKKAGQMALSNNVTIEDHSTSEQVTHTLGEFLAMTTDNLVIKGYNFNQFSWDGGFAQVAVCGACKWTADFEVPTVAY